MTRNRLAAIAIVILAIIPRVSHLRSLSFENDEIAEATWSSLPFDEMMVRVRQDAVHPPGDYLIQYVVGRIGPDWVRRLPSVIAGVATVGVVTALGGPAAGLLLALSPIHIYYSQNVRPYAMGLFFVAASLLALRRCGAAPAHDLALVGPRPAQRGEGGRRPGEGYELAWSVFVFLAAGMLYFAGAVAALAGLLRIPWRRYLVHCGIWIVLYAPWFTVIRHASMIPSPNARETLNWEWWRWRIESLGTGSDRAWVPVSLGSWAFWLLVAIGLIASYRIVSARLAAFVFVAGTLLEIVVLQIHPHFPTVRYFMPSWIAAFPLAGLGVQILWQRWFTRPVAIAALAVFIGFSALKIEEYRREHSDWRGVAEFVHTRIKPGETLVITNEWVRRNFGYYWRNPPAVNVSIYSPDGLDQFGPAWIVTGGCVPRDAAKAAPLMMRSPQTDQAEVRYLRAGRSMTRREICPN